MKFNIKTLESNNKETLLTGIAKAMADTSKNAWGVACLMARLIELDKNNVNDICERFEFKRATVYAYAKAFLNANEIELKMAEWTISKFAVLNSLELDIIKDAVEQGTVTGDMTQAELKAFVKSFKAIEDKSEGECESEGAESSNDDILNTVVIMGKKYLVTQEQLEKIISIINEEA